MSPGERPTDAQPADEPAVEGEAVELLDDPAPIDPPPGAGDATRVTPPEPVARPVVPPAMPHVPPTTPLSAVSEAGAPIADGHGPDPLDGHGSDPLTDPLKKLAAERPEYVVGAAFAGGILAAMILRRLGN